VDLDVALLPTGFHSPWLKAVMAVLSVPYSMLAFNRGRAVPLVCPLKLPLITPGSATQAR